MIDLMVFCERSMMHMGVVVFPIIMGVEISFSNQKATECKGIRISSVPGYTVAPT
jgi:hypothetical protein